MQPVPRPTVRVLVLDTSGAILLQRFVGEQDKLPFWVPPGGAFEPGEDAWSAARRELFEETGRRDIVAERHVWNREHVWSWRGVTYRSIETWLLAEPIERFAPVSDHHTPDEREDITGWRWFTVEELEVERVRTVPLDLAPRLRRLLAEGPPAEPEDIGV